MTRTFFPVRFRAPIRIKILALIIGALTLSLASYLYVGSSLLVKDKESYIYDFQASELRATTNDVSNQILAMIHGYQLAARGTKTIDDLFRPANAYGVSGLIVLNPVTPDRFSIEKVLGADSASAEAAIQSLNLKPGSMQPSDVVARSAGQGSLIVGFWVKEASQQDRFLAAVIQFDRKILAATPQALDVQLFDASGDAWLTKSGGGSNFFHDAPELRNTVTAATFKSGVREERIAGHATIVGYRKFFDDQLIAVGMVPKDAAFTGARSLIFRSIGLGISILLLAIGMTFAVARQLTRRIAQMWEATQRVSVGDFSVRVDVDSAFDDEIVSLGNSFNSMAGKINDLVIATADKARMEKELEMAQAMQSTFFPSKDFESSNVKLAGLYRPASECAGDWWHYSSYENFLVMAMGDVTGHGASSALVTGAAHGAFCLFIDELEKLKPSHPSVNRLVNLMNTAVRATGGNHVSMTLVACVIDLETGQMSMINAAHTPLTICRPHGGLEPRKQIVPIMSSRCPALGTHPEIDVDAQVTQLEPGDFLFWYTDGLFDSRVSDGAKLRKPDLLRGLLKSSVSTTEDPRKIVDEIAARGTEFFGSDPKNRSDDISIAIATVSTAAQWLRKAA